MSAHGKPVIQAIDKRHAEIKHEIDEQRACIFYQKDLQKREELLEDYHGDGIHECGDVYILK